MGTGGSGLFSDPVATRRARTAVTSVDQHSSASCWTKPWPFSVRSANMGKAVRKVETNLSGRTSRAAFERSSSPISSRIETVTVSALPLAPTKLWRAVGISGMAFITWRPELR